MNKVKHFFSEVFKRHTEDDAEQVVIVGAPGTIPDPATLSSECPRPWLYTRVLAFFLLVTALLFLANVLANPGTLSNVMVVGAFAVPFTTLVLLFEFNVYRNISFYTVLKALFIGGALSLIVTAVLPSFQFHIISRTVSAFAAGIGEEIAKMLVVYWILKRNKAYPYILNGIVIGAAVGAGFAIFETAGYAMGYLLGGDNAWLGKDAMTTLAIRNLLAPGGHVVWAAMSGAGLLMAVRREPLSAKVFRKKLFWAVFSIPVILHVLWDLFAMEAIPLAHTWTIDVVLVFLVLIAWIAVAWFLRRGLEEIDMLNAMILYQPQEAHEALAAGPWRRWAARSLDVFLGEVVVMFALKRVLYYFGLGDSFNGLNQAVASIIVLPFLLLLEAIIFELFGTTFGKWIFSLSVRDLNGKDASSKSYFKRLVRLWASGLGLGIPVIYLFTYIGQYRRISSGKQASYDESLGLRVDKERIHPLRWLALIPVALLVGFLAIVSAMSANNATNPLIEERVNPSIAWLVEGSGLDYEVLEKGFVSIPFSIGDREQKCLVFPQPLPEVNWGRTNIFVISIAAPCSTADGKTIHSILADNINRSTRIWSEMNGLLVLRSIIPLRVSPAYFRDEISEMAKEADACEKEISGKDEY